MKKQLFLFKFLLVVCCSSLFAQEVKIRVYYNKEMSKVSFSPVNANYVIWGDQGKIVSLNIHQEFIATISGDSIHLAEKGKRIGVYSFLRFAPLKADSFKTAHFSLKPEAGTKGKHFSGNLFLTAAAGSLQCLNEVDLESYIPGVIQGEVGTLNPYEFKKVKAIIIRTYALSNLQKHATEGFHLCDKVHCQVYNGVSYQKDILKSVIDTRGQVLVDDSLKLITTLFFSNCGGQTCNSEDVWYKPFPYLVSVQDTFCKSKTSASWTKKISKKEWLGYFKRKFGFPIDDSAYVHYLLNFSQPVRKKNLIEEGFCIPLRAIREDWNLRSTYFSIKTDGEFVILTGKGFGHGVGLCQEGAMEMAKKGFSVKEIIDHFYKNVLLVDLSRIDFYKSDNSDE